MELFGGGYAVFLAERGALLADPFSDLWRAFAELASVGHERPDLHFKGVGNIDPVILIRRSHDVEFLDFVWQQALVHQFREVPGIL